MPATTRSAACGPQRSNAAWAWSVSVNPTATAFAHGRIGDVRDGVVSVPMTVRTRVFGTVRATLRLTFTGDGDDKQLNWRPNLVFPGL